MQIGVNSILKIIGFENDIFCRFESNYSRMKKIYFLLSLFFISFCLQAQTSTIVVKINYRYLDFNAIDNKQILSGRFHEFLNENGKSEIEKLAALIPSISSSPLEKVFPFLTTKDTVSISRLGHKITIPSFWSTFRLTMEEDAATKAIPILHDFAPFIDYAHYDYPVELASVPNDQYFSQQLALSSLDTTVGINVQEAWGIETGEPFIKVGVHDSGIDSLHPDLNVLFGGTYNKNNYADAGWGSNADSHGTAVAGIIGARRNNGIGIAGIAGGNGTDSTGVHLLDFKFTYGIDLSASYFMASVVDAARSVGSYWQYPLGYYSPESEPYFDNAPGFGIHIGNHSYIIKPIELSEIGPKNKDIGPPTSFSSSDCNVCREAFLFSLKNGVINVVARGNGYSISTDPVPPTQVEDHFPPSLPDNWVISVGASALDGTTVQNGINQSTSEQTTGFYSLYGGNMDLIAPGSNALVYTTKTTTSGQNYDSFNGTSAATPHVSGVVALLLSHYNKGCYNNRNLSIEDVEYILEKSATRINGEEYEELTGWGRLNAGKALKMIENPTKQIIHPDSLIGYEIIAQDTIALGYREAFVTDNWGPISATIPLERNREYKVVRTLIETTYSFDEYITSSTQIVDYWARPSVSNSIEFYRDTIAFAAIIPPSVLDTLYKFDFINLTPFDTIVQFDTVNNQIKLRGYYYHFIGRYIDVAIENGSTYNGEDLFEDPFNSTDIWYPTNPFIETPRMGFTIYIHDTSLVELYDFPCDSVNLLYDEFLQLDESTIDLNFDVFPNPFNHELTIRFESFDHYSVTLYDLTGKQKQKWLLHEKELTIDVQELSRGMYILHCSNDKSSKTVKLIKL